MLLDALIFDIDGTLVDSTPAVERTWRAVAAARGLDAQAILATSHGRRSEDIIADLVPADQYAAAVAELEQLELAELDDVCALPNSAQLLASLPTHRWAVVTSGSQRLMRARLRAAGLPAPEVFIGTEDVQAGKPDPQGHLLAARALNASSFAVIEDAPAGIAAGKAAGAFVIAVATSHEKSQLSAADIVLDDLGRLSASSTPEGLIVDF